MSYRSMGLTGSRLEDLCVRELVLGDGYGVNFVGYDDEPARELLLLDLERGEES